MSKVSLINGHIDGSDRCVICGKDIPEGNQVCVICGKTEQERFDLMRDEIIDLKNEINRLQAENENLNAEVGKMVAENERLEKALKQTLTDIREAKVLVANDIETAKAEAYKKFCEKLHTEILEARESNFKAKDGRIAKSKKYGIPIDVEDSFLMYCDGKIHALDGIDYFAYNLIKEMVGEDNVD
jgi:DNA repair exonuclease SbcCD ATPase subunit